MNGTIGLNGKQSVFHDERKRWEPVNRQAAQVLRKATWEQMPPSEPRYLPSPQEKAETLQKAAAARYAMLKAESDEKDRQRAMQQKPEPKPKFATCRQHAKRVLRTIHKRKGLPPPTWGEIAAFQKQQPLYMQPLHLPSEKDEPRHE